MTVPPIVPAGTPTDVASIVEAVLNSSHRRQKLTQFAEEAAKLRTANEKLETQVADLKAKLPGSGAVVLTKEQGEDWTAYQALGKPADVKVLITEHADLKVKQVERDEEQLYADAAEAMGWENTAVAIRWLKREKVVVTFQDVRSKDEDNKTVVTRTPMVRLKADEKATPVALADYIDEQAPEFVEIFSQPPAEGEEEGEGTEDGQAHRTAARNVPRGTNGTGRSTEGGVPIAALRGTKASTTAPKRDQKKIDEIEQAALKTGAYNV